ncbi:MAG: amidinotransferase [Anaerolineales bacterium]|nr:MAG: amidinotransferase [Anaerolineales bacterium]
MFTHAITRLPGGNFSDGITTSNLGQPSYPLILEQHRAYRQALLSLGLDVIVLPAEPDYPDAYFVEDPAIVTPNIAVVTYPGASPRQGEQVSLEPFLQYYRTIFHIQPPGTVEGGDVLMVGNHFFIGLSERTNAEGAEQLMAFLRNAGHTAETIAVSAGLHLKSSVNHLGEGVLLITRELFDIPAFASYHKILVDDSEAYAANTLWVNGSLLVPSGFPKTRVKLAALDMPIIDLDVSEVQKMDGGLTCMSLRF